MGAAAGQQRAIPTQPTNVAQLQGGASAANPYAQAAGAQAQALSTTGQLTGYRTPSAAIGATGRAMQYQPQNVQATSYGASTLSAPQQAASQMGAYTNPYESQVVQQALRDVGSTAQQGFNQLDAQATQAKAFGGSRHGIAQAELAKGYTQQMADTAARMRQQGFNTALGAAQFDVGQQQAAAAANQAALNQAAQFGATQGMTAQQLNQAAGLQGAQARLGAAGQLSDMALQAARMRQAGAGQLAGLGQQSFDYGQSIQDRQMQQGATQRGAMQQLIDRGQQNFQDQYGAPQGLQTFLSAVYGAPSMTGQTESFSPGLFNYMQLGAQMMPKGPF